MIPHGHSTASRVVIITCSITRLIWHAWQVRQCVAQCHRHHRRTTCKCALSQGRDRIRHYKRLKIAAAPERSCTNARQSFTIDGHCLEVSATLKRTIRNRRHCCRNRHAHGAGLPCKYAGFKCRHGIAAQRIGDCEGRRLERNCRNSTSAIRPHVSGSIRPCISPCTQRRKQCRCDYGNHRMHLQFSHVYAFLFPRLFPYRLAALGAEKKSGVPYIFTSQVRHRQTPLSKHD